MEKVQIRLNIFKMLVDFLFDIRKRDGGFEIIEDEVLLKMDDKALYDYVMDFKNEYFKKYQISKVLYDGKINVINNALGMHTFVSRVQGGKLKSKNEIRVATIFKNMPEEFLQMIVVHELAHFKEKDHDKAFYNLCTFVMPSYHQVGTTL